MKILVNGATGECGPVVSCKPEVMRFDHRGTRFAYDPNSMRLAVLDKEDEDSVLESFAIPLKPNFHLGIPSHVAAICFDTTRACNLRCSYCFARNDAERGKELHLSVEDALVGLRLLLGKDVCSGQVPKHRAQYSFFGGEPLTRFDFMQRMVEHIESWIPCQHHFHVTTNGTLITPEIAKFLSLHNFSTIVSIDGSEKAHDECRVRADGTGSYAAVLSGLECLRTYAPNVIRSTTLRSTFTPKSILTESIAERVAHLNGLVGQNLGSYVSVEPSTLGEHTCGNRTIVEEEGIDYTQWRDVWQKRYDDAADAWLELLQADRPCYFHHFISYNRRLIHCMPGCSECGSAKGYYTLAPGGDIFACHHEGNTLVGNIRTGGVDAELAAAWQDNRYYARLKCPSCLIRNWCGGGCREFSASSGLGLSMPVPSECELKWILFRTNAWILSKVLPDARLRAIALKYWGDKRQQKSCTPKQG